MSSLTPTARVILGLVKAGAETGYEIKSITDVSTRFFWGASYGQIYPELRRLEAAGLVEGEDQPRGAVRRRVYRITPKGEGALRQWLVEEGSLYDLRDEGLLKLFFSDELDEGDALELVRRRRAWFEGVVAHFNSIRPPISEESSMFEVWRYGVALMTWNADWFAELERRLSRRRRGRASRPGENRDRSP
jgi:DNA-binding PadR family transcriptional regulator